MKFPFKLPSFLINKYLLALMAFAVWMLFFDSNNILVQSERRSELQQLERSKTFYAAEIEKERKFSQDLKANPVTIEKYARERYLMKRDNEDLYLVPEDSTTVE